MANLHDIERRITSVKSTRQITSTMQMIASTKVHSASKRLEKAHPYKESICKMLASVSEGQTDISHPLLEKREDVKTSLIVVIVSDKGLAGGFNSNILRSDQSYIDSNKKEGKKTKIICCGKKAHTYFQFRKYQTELEFVGTSDNPQFEQAEEIGNYCIENFKDENIDEVIVIYNKCKNSMEQTVENVKVLPVEANDLSSVAEQDDKSSKNEFTQEIVYEPTSVEVLSGLIPTYIRTVIFDSLLDSAAGEQVARRVAMQAATDSADEMIETLTRLYNSVRQSAITTEITEIVGGADALAEES